MVLVASTSSRVGIGRQVIQEFKERWDLADEESVVNKRLHGRHGCVPVFGGTNDGNLGELAVEKDGGLRHDQIGLQVIGRGSSIELIKREVAIGDVGSVAGLIVPGLKMRGFSRTDAEQNPQDLRMGDALGELWI